MNNLFKLILIVGVTLYLVPSTLAIEYFDINKPGIEKLNISITANGSSDIVDMVVKKLSSQLDKTLLFNIVDDAEKSAFNLEISTTNESKTVAVNLTGVQDPSFDATSIGVRFRNEDEQYVSLKSSQIGNFLVKSLMGIKGSLGSIIVWSEKKKGESQSSLVMKRFGSDEHKKITYNLYSNTGASWSPKGDKIIYAAQTASGSKILMQGFLPLRYKSKQIYFEKGVGSSATWGSNNKIYLSKYMGERNTDIFEYKVVRGTSGDMISQGRNITKHPAIETEAVLSPDGTQLAYISDRTGTPQVYLMDLSTQKTARLTKKGKNNTSPDWSPDASMISFSGTLGGPSAIYRVRTDDKLGLVKQVSPKGMLAESPAWSSDGSMIAFQAKTGRDWKIYYVLSSGSTAKRLTNTGAGINEYMPSWNSGLK